MSTKRIALVTHDTRKEIMVEWVGRHRDLLREMAMFVAGATGRRITDVSKACSQSTADAVFYHLISERNV